MARGARISDHVERPSQAVLHEVIKAGKQANSTQRYRCQNGQCARRIFLLRYQDRGRAPDIRRQVMDMALNGSGIRDTARVLRISPQP